jgi:nicotinamide-nucleotide amidase
MGRVHLILIGDELLSGKRQDTHLKRIASDLTERGGRLETCETIRDEPGAVEATVRRYLAPEAAIVTTGGLGPTVDDLTREGISAATGVELVANPDLWEDLKSRFERAGRKISESNRSQALVPESGTFFHNPNGTAPGLVFEPQEHNNACVIALPGPPRELAPMWRDSALPYLEKKFSWPPPPMMAQMRFALIGESSIDEKMRPLIQPYPDIVLSSLIRIGRVDVTLSLPLGYPDGERILEEISQETMERLPEFAYDYQDNLNGHEFQPKDLEEVVGVRLRGSGETVSVAESCTGGLLAKYLTDFPGSSDFFAGGIVSYSNDLKREILGVSWTTLEKKGAVSEETASEMVEGILRRTGSDWGLALTGIAGPGGGTAEKPVGLVYIGVGNREDRKVHCYEFPGDREAIRERSVVAALRLLWWRIR